MSYIHLVGGYGTAAVLLPLAARWRPDLWPRQDAGDASGWPLVRVAGMVVAVVVIGQMVQAWHLTGDTPGRRILLRIVSQLLIFSPVFVAAVIAARRGTAYARRIAFMPTDRVMARLACGTASAAAALVAHQLLSGRIARLAPTAMQLIDPVRSSHAVQVLGEDLGIGILLAAALTRLKPRTAALVTGGLFAAGHIPAMVMSGESLSDLARLLADGALAAGMVTLLYRMRDVWAIWPVHLIMDLTQFLDQ